MSNPAKFACALAVFAMLCGPAPAHLPDAAQVLRQSWQSETIYIPTTCIDEFDIERIEQDEDDLPLCPPL